MLLSSDETAASTLMSLAAPAVYSLRYFIAASFRSTLVVRNAPTSHTFTQKGSRADREMHCEFSMLAPMNKQIHTLSQDTLNINQSNTSGIFATQVL